MVRAYGLQLVITCCSPFPAFLLAHPNRSRGCPPLRGKDILMSMRCSLAWDKAVWWLMWLASLAIPPEQPPSCRLYCAYKLPLSQELRCDLRGRLFECCLFSLWYAGFLSRQCMLAMSPTKWYAKKPKKKTFTWRQLINILAIGHVLWQTALIYSDMPGLSHSRHPYAAPLNHEAVKLGCTPTSFKIFFFLSLLLSAVS